MALATVLASWVVFAFCTLLVGALPAQPRSLHKRSVTGPVISTDFPDPAVVLVGSTYYAFATTGNGRNVQVATSPDFATWTVLDTDALPLSSPPSWINANAPSIWAPDVIQLSNGVFALTYSASTAQDTSKHCVGVATSGTVTGPYIPVSDTPFVCPLSQGGAIDSSYFMDTDGSLYIVYKVDGNSIGADTPIMIQQVADDGFSIGNFGAAVQILTNGPYDSGIVEAPSMLRVSGTSLYILTFSSALYSTDSYDASYATAYSPTASFEKSSSPLLLTGDYDLGAPGGGDLIDTGNGVKMVFHANIGGPDHNGAPRGMWTANVDINVDARTISV